MQGGHRPIISLYSTPTLTSHPQPATLSSTATPSPQLQLETLTLYPQSPPSDAEVMLEEEVREAVISTAGTAAGAGAFGVLLTAVLPTTVEDLLAMSLAAMVSVQGHRGAGALLGGGGWNGAACCQPGRQG